MRYHARTQEWSRWADVTPQYLPEETGHLVGLKLAPNRVVTRLAVMPYASGGLNVRDRYGELVDQDGNAGFDVRLDLARKQTNVLTVQAGLQPDRSHRPRPQLQLQRKVSL